MSVTATAAVAPASRLRVIEWTGHYRVRPGRPTLRDAWVQEPDGAVRLYALREEWAA